MRLKYINFAYLPKSKSIFCTVLLARIRLTFIHAISHPFITWDSRFPHPIYNCTLQSLWHMFRISLGNTSGTCNCSAPWRQFSWYCSHGHSTIWHSRPGPMTSYCRRVRECLRTQMWIHEFIYHTQCRPQQQKLMTINRDGIHLFIIIYIYSLVTLNLPGHCNWRLFRHQSGLSSK